MFSSLWIFSKNFQGCITVYLSRYEQSNRLCKCDFESSLSRNRIHAKDYSATAVSEQFRCELCFAFLCFSLLHVSHATRLYYHVHVSLSTAFFIFFYFYPHQINHWIDSVELHSIIWKSFWQDTILIIFLQYLTAYHITTRYSMRSVLYFKN